MKNSSITLFKIKLRNKYVFAKKRQETRDSTCT